MFAESIARQMFYAFLFDEDYRFEIPENIKPQVEEELMWKKVELAQRNGHENLVEIL